MSTPDTNDKEPRGAPLIEPEPPTGASTLGEMDTDRILQDTAALPRSTRDEHASVEPEHDQSVGPSVEGASETVDAPADHDTEPTPAAARRRVNLLAIIALVLAVALSPLATLFGYIAVGQVRRAHQKGEAIAWLAVGLGWLWTIGYVIVGAVVAVTWFQLT